MHWFKNKNSFIGWSNIREALPASYEVKPSCHPNPQMSSIFIYIWSKVWEIISNPAMLDIIYDQSNQSQKLHNILEHVTPYPKRSNSWYFIPNVKKKWNDNWPLPSIFFGYVIYPKPYKFQAKVLFGMTTGFCLVLSGLYALWSS